MDETQLNDAFLENCRDHLNEHGIMVINFWANDFRQTLLRQQAVKRTFGENALSLHVRGGNDIIFAFKNNIPKLNKRTFISSAQQLGLKLDIPLQNLAGNLWQSNARVLQFSQYR
jgi:spermidine synthase